MPDDVVAPVRRSAWWRRVSGRMDKASNAFSAEMHGLAAPGRKLDDVFYEELTEVLIAADCGVELAERLAAALRQRVRSEKLADGAAAIAALKAEILVVMNAYDRSLNLSNVPSVVLVVGVNGSGKTTTIGKLAYRLREEGRTSLIAAADTYRAAAIDQMRVWADRAGTDVVAHQPGADPGAVVFDAIQAAEARRVDVILVDTAGRLHTKVNLMAELGKIRRVVERLIPEAPHEVLLVVDATTGMNAMRQALAFHETTTLTGLVITKLDGSARGGTLLAVEEQLKVPVKLVGMGEDLDDLNVFDPSAYLDTIFGATS
ncbi:MAG: signal recognition particle-docking protein FtsY [Candidatus Dormibacteria bacterium]